MFNKYEIINKLNQMDQHDIATMVKEAMDESGVKYTNGPGEIIFNGLIPEPMENDEVDLYLEIEDLLEYDSSTGNIKVDKDLFDDFVPNTIIHICFVDSEKEDGLVNEYVMTSEDDDGIYMEWLDAWNMTIQN